MKNSIVICLALLITSSLFSQRKVEAIYPVQNERTIVLDFNFAEDIQLLQWDKKEAKVTASVSIDDGAGNESYSLKTEKQLINF